jgi:hypothetical protein
MKKKVIYIFCLIFSFHNLTAMVDVVSPQEVAPTRLGSEWGLKLFPGTVEGQLISYMQAVVLQNVAQRFVKRADFKKLFADLEESPLKMMLRRQYYLYTKGVAVDNVPVEN